MCKKYGRARQDTDGNIRGTSRKQRMFYHTKIFIDNRKEKEYAGFMTHLHLLLHIVTLDD